jgi:hypothetical protein
MLPVENLEMFTTACGFILPVCFPKVQNYGHLTIKKESGKR